MADSTGSESPPSLTALVGGIVNDLQQLIRQELQLARTEVKQEWDKTKTAAVSLAAGAGMACVAGLLLCHMVVYILNEEAKLQLWVSYGIVGGVLVVFSGLLLAIGRAKATDVHVVPPQTTETMKENVQWIKNQT
jgi:hypothetical protein